MKAKQENEAEIALDVRSATRARVESEILALYFAFQANKELKY